MSEVVTKYHTPWEPDSPPDWKRQNLGVTPVFWTETIPLFEADGKTPRIGADGKPLTIEQEYYRIMVAGDGLAEPSGLVEAAIKERFAEEYQAWKDNIAAAHQGWALEEWPVVSKRQINELNACNIFSVRDLAALSDGNIHSVTNGRALREKAKVWIEDKEGHAVTDKLAEENAVLQGRLEAQQRRIERLEANQAPLRPKGKRPPVSAATREKHRVNMLARNAASFDQVAP